MELCWGRKRHDAVVVVEVAASQRLLRIRHRKAQAMGRGCDRRNRVGAGKEMAMGLGRMRGIGSRGLVRQHANARQTMGLAKVHGRMLGTGKMGRETQLVNAADSELGALGKPPCSNRDFAVEELKRLPGTCLGFVLEELVRLPGIDPASVVEELEKLLWHNCDVVWEVQATHHGVGTGIGPEAHETGEGHRSRVVWEELEIRREAGNDSRRPVRETRVRVYVSHVVTEVLARLRVIRVFSWTMVSAILRADLTVFSLKRLAVGSLGFR